MSYKWHLRGRHRHVRSTPINVPFLWEDGLNGRHSALFLIFLPTPPLFINHSINRLLINFKSVQVILSCCVCTDVRVRRTWTQRMGWQSQIRYTFHAAVMYVPSNVNIFAFKYRLASPETIRLKTSSMVRSTSVAESFSAVLHCRSTAAAGANARYDRPWEFCKARTGQESSCRLTTMSTTCTVY